MYQNTTREEDQTLKEAVNGTLIQDIVNIVERMDGEITDWKDQTGCDDPKDAANKIADLEQRIHALENAS